MSTSGTATFEGLTSDIIKDALYTINAIPAGSYEELVATGDSETVAHAKRVLMRMVNDWQNEGANLWKMERTTQALVASTASYTLAALTVDVLPEGIFLRDSSGNDRKMRLIGRREYTAIVDKDQTGTPTLLYVEKVTANTATVLGVSHAYQGGIILYPWPVPDSATPVLHYTRLKKIEDSTTDANDPDYPVRFQDALVFGLAWKLSFAYQVPADRLRMLKEEAMATKARAFMDDKERGGVHFMMQRSFHGIGY